MDGGPFKSQYQTMPSWWPCFRADAIVPAPAPATAPAAHYKSAGCAFTDGKHVLAGYQPHKRCAGITGIGGRREPSETDPLRTALRETVEELFHLSSSEIPSGLLNHLHEKLAPRRIIQKKGYVNFIFALEDLNVLLILCRRAGLRTALYPEQKVPSDWLGLISKRLHHPDSEISALCLLPVVPEAAATEKPLVLPEFLTDMRDFQNDEGRAV